MYCVVTDEHSFSFYVHSQVETASFSKNKKINKTAGCWGHQFSEGSVQLTNNNTELCFYFKCSFKGKCIYLPMDVDDRAQETPRPTLPVHVEHSQDLQEANAPGKYQHLKADVVRACRHISKLCKWVFELQFLWESILGLQVFLFPLSWRSIRVAFVSPGSHWVELTSALFIDHFWTSWFKTSCHSCFIIFFLWDYMLCTFLKLWRYEMYHQIIWLKAPFMPLTFRLSHSGECSHVCGVVQSHQNPIRANENDFAWPPYTKLDQGEINLYYFHVREHENTNRSSDLDC